MQNVLLLHLRESLQLTPERIEELTGIPVQQYRDYENASSFISTEDLELLSTLLGVKKEHLDSYSRQLHFFSHYQGILDGQDKKIRRLTETLKRKIKKTASEPKRRAETHSCNPLSFQNQNGVQ